MVVIAFDYLSILPVSRKRHAMGNFYGCVRYPHQLGTPPELVMTYRISISD